MGQQHGRVTMGKEEGEHVKPVARGEGNMWEAKAVAAATETNKSGQVKSDQSLCPESPPPVLLTTSPNQEGDVVVSGSNKMSRLFQRKASIKVCPDFQSDSTRDQLLSEVCSSASLPSNRVQHLLFTNVQVPVAMTNADNVEDGFISVTQLYNSLNDGQLSSYMFDPTFMLIVDTRMAEDYFKQHIVTAIHMSNLTNAHKMEPLHAYTMVIVYDNKGLSRSLKESTLSKIIKDMLAQGTHAFIVQGGFDRFHRKHPYLCTEKIPKTGRQRSELLLQYPSIVLEDQLYLGRIDQATNEKIVTDLAITHIVNITLEQLSPFSGRIHYHTVNLEDDCASDLLSEFLTTSKFIKDAIDSEGRVLVHCNLGVSRSASVVIAYLMCTQHWVLRDAYNYLKEHRPIIHPNHGFLTQLSHFEEILYGHKFTDTAKLKA